MGIKIVILLVWLISCSSQPKLESLGYKHNKNDLIRAIDENNLEAVQAFIQAKAFLQIQTKEGIPLVNRALYNGNYQIALSLIEAGAPSSIDDGLDGAPLYIALSKLTDEVNPNLDLVLMILLPNEKWHGPINQNEQTLLMLLAEKGKLNMVKIALSNGAQKDKVDLSGKTALEYAKENNHNKIVELLK